jgi:hypothetical protein
MSTTMKTFSKNTAEGKHLEEINLWKWVKYDIFSFYSHKNVKSRKQGEYKIGVHESEKGAS